MFKLEVDPTFFGDVDIPVPGKSPVRVPFEFRHKTDEEFDAMIKALRNEERSVKELVREVVAGWKSPGLEFSSDALESCFKIFPGSPLAIWMSFRSSLLEGKRKN